jgi:hypothetical protein
VADKAHIGFDILVAQSEAALDAVLDRGIACSQAFDDVLSRRMGTQSPANDETVGSESAETIGTGIAPEDPAPDAATAGLAETVSIDLLLPDVMVQGTVSHVPVAGSPSEESVIV